MRISSDNYRIGPSRSTLSSRIRWYLTLASDRSLRTYTGDPPLSPRAYSAVYTSMKPYIPGGSTVLIHYNLAGYTREQFHQFIANETTMHTQNRKDAELFVDRLRQCRKQEV